MPQATISWTPGQNTLTQDLMYKRRSSLTWLTAKHYENGTTATDVIQGLVENVIYDFQILGTCQYTAAGAHTQSAVFSYIYFSCPAVSLTPSYTSVDFSFSHQSNNSIDKFTVTLLSTNPDGTTAGTVASQVFPASGTTLVPGTISGTFSSLASTGDTAYKIQVTMNATADYTKVCDASAFRSLVLPTCGYATGVTATISA